MKVDVGVVRSVCVVWLKDVDVVWLWIVLVLVLELEPELVLVVEVASVVHGANSVAVGKL